MTASIARIAGNTFASRVLGFVRDLVIARLFGADTATDAFFVAFKIPNFMRRLFAEGVFSLALVPVLTEYKSERPFAELKLLVDRIAGTLGLVLIIATALGLVSAPLLLVLFAPGFMNDAGQAELAAEMLRITIPYLSLIALTAFAGAILGTYERFGIPAFTPALLNLSLIACALWLAPAMERPILALAWGVLIGGALQLALQLPFLARLGLLPRPRLAPRDAGVKRVARQMAPALLGASVTQINLLIDTLLASFLVSGSISWLYYSDRLVELPLGLLGVAIGTVILPRLSRYHTLSSPHALSQTLDKALRWVLLLGLPATVGLIVLAKPLLATLFYSGEFGAHEVEMASRSLVAYAAGLVAFMTIKVLVTAFYARLETRAPVRIAAIAMLANIVLSLVLMGPLGHAGLALATSLAATVNAGLLLQRLLDTGTYRPEPGWRVLLLKGIGATLLTATVVHLGAGPISDWLAWDAWRRAGALAIWIGVGALIYTATLLALGIRLGELIPATETQRRNDCAEKG
jgi:putative peptidoglycan lipid II flippase